MKKPVAEFETQNSAAYLNELTNNCNLFEESYFKNLLNAPYISCCFLSAVIMSIIVNPWMLFVMLVLAIITVWITKLTGAKLEKRTADYMKGAEEYTALLKDDFSGFRLIRCFGIYNNISTRHRIKNEEVEELARGRNNGLVLCVYCGEFIGLFSTLLIMGITAGLAIRGAVSIGTVLAFGELIGKIISPITDLPQILVNLKSARPLKEGFLKLMNSKEEEGTLQLPEFTREVKLSEVSFSYDGRKTALHNVNCQLEKGKKYAIVGASGSGKSTFLSLLLGFYRNYEGSICYDGKELKEIQSQELYRQAGIVSQETFLFEDTLRNNLTLYHDTYSDEEIINVLKTAGLEHFFNSLPEGLNTVIKEGGKNLSGGEKQRINLARVLLKNSVLLFFDEFTASLDEKTAYELERYVLSIPNKTIFTITHRLNPEILTKYDKILVFLNGDLIEMGSYEQLFSQNGIFCKIIGKDQSDSSTDGIGIFAV